MIGNYRGYKDEDFCAMFDGHNGTETSRKSAEHLHQILKTNLELLEKQWGSTGSHKLSSSVDAPFLASPKNESSESSKTVLSTPISSEIDKQTKSTSEKTVADILKNTFLDTNLMLKEFNVMDGSTALVAYAIRDKVCSPTQFTFQDLCSKRWGQSGCFVAQ
jgi:serine/threonine protein phosphatase PrpC